MGISPNKVPSLGWALGDLAERNGKLSDDPLESQIVFQNDPWVQGLSHLGDFCSWTLHWFDERSVGAGLGRGCSQVLWKWIFNFGRTICGSNRQSMETLTVDTKCWLWFLKFLLWWTICGYDGCFVRTSINPMFFIVHSVRKWSNSRLWVMFTTHVQGFSRVFMWHVRQLIARFWALVVRCI